MSALPVGRTSWSLSKAVLQWWRDWTRRSSALELKCCGEDEVERMAKDLGLSASELRRVAKLGPGSADLLLCGCGARPRSKRSIPDRTSSFPGPSVSLRYIGWREKRGRRLNHKGTKTQRKSVLFPNLVS